MRKLLKRKWLVVAAAAALLAVVFGMGGNATASLAAEESRNVCGLKGTVKFAGGRGNTGTEYVASWYENADSEAIVLNGKVEMPGGSACTPSSVRYILFIGNTVVTKTVWNASEHARSSALSSLLGSLEPMTYPYHGSIKNDVAMRAELQFELAHSRTRGWHTAAVDGAMLLNGAGSIERNDGTSRFAEGETATFRVVTGNGGPWVIQTFTGTGEQACGGLSLNLRTASAWSGGGWSRLDPGAFARCNEIKLDGKFDGKIQMTIPKGAFRSDGKNEWKITLSNAVTKHAEERAFVIDNSKLAPEVPVVTASPKKFEVGDEVTLKFEARPNGISQSAIKKFTVTVWYGEKNSIPASGEDLVYSSKEFTATKSGTKYVGEAKFTAAKSAKVWWRVNAIDDAGRPSGTLINSRQVDELEAGGMKDPNSGGEGHIEPAGTEVPAGNGSPPPADTMRGLLIAGAVGAVLGLLSYAYVPLRAPAARGAVALAALGASLWFLPGVVG